MTDSPHVEIFRCDDTGQWGWQCFTCGAERFVYPHTSVAADKDADQHRIECAA